MEDAAAIGVLVNGMKVAGWAEAEYRKKIRAERSVDFFTYVRCVSALALIAAILGFMFNRQAEIQKIVSTGFHRAAKQATTSDTIRQQAIKHEKDVDQINQQFHKPS